MSLGRRVIQRWKRYDVLLTLDAEELLAMEQSKSILQQQQAAHARDNSSSSSRDAEDYNRQPIDLPSLIRRWEVARSTASMHAYKPHVVQVRPLFQGRAVCVVEEQVPPREHARAMQLCTELGAEVGGAGGWGSSLCMLV